MVPAGTVSVASFGLVSPGATTTPPARMSTAGAAAVCRTVTRASPAGTAEATFANGVRNRGPSAGRWATTVALAPARTATYPAGAAGGVPTRVLSEGG